MITGIKLGEWRTNTEPRKVNKASEWYYFWGITDEDGLCSYLDGTSMTLTVEEVLDWMIKSISKFGCKSSTQAGLRGSAVQKPVSSTFSGNLCHFLLWLPLSAKIPPDTTWIFAGLRKWKKLRFFHHAICNPHLKSAMMSQRSPRWKITKADILL